MAHVRQRLKKGVLVASSSKKTKTTPAATKEAGPFGFSNNAATVKSVVTVQKDTTLDVCSAIAIVMNGATATLPLEGVAPGTEITVVASGQEAFVKTDAAGTLVPVASGNATSFYWDGAAWTVECCFPAAMAGKTHRTTEDIAIPCDVGLLTAVPATDQVLRVTLCASPNPGDQVKVANNGDPTGDVEVDGGPLDGVDARLVGGPLSVPAGTAADFVFAGSNDGSGDWKPVCCAYAVFPDVAGMFDVPPRGTPTLVYVVADATVRLPADSPAGALVTVVNDKPEQDDVFVTGTSDGPMPRGPATVAFGTAVDFVKSDDGTWKPKTEPGATTYDGVTGNFQVPSGPLEQVVEVTGDGAVTLPTGSVAGDLVTVINAGGTQDGVTVTGTSDGPLPAGPSQITQDGATSFIKAPDGTWKPVEGPGATTYDDVSGAFDVPVGPKETNVIATDDATVTLPAGAAQGATVTVFNNADEEDGVLVTGTVDGPIPQGTVTVPNGTAVEFVKTPQVPGGGDWKPVSPAGLFHENSVTQDVLVQRSAGDGLGFTDLVAAAVLGEAGTRILIWTSFNFRGTTGALELLRLVVTDPNSVDHVVPFTQASVALAPSVDSPQFFGTGALNGSFDVAVPGTHTARLQWDEPTSGDVFMNPAPVDVPPRPGNATITVEDVAV